MLTDSMPKEATSRKTIDLAPGQRQAAGLVILAALTLDKEPRQYMTISNLLVIAKV